MYKDGTFEIKNVSTGDTGFYMCFAKYRSLLYESRQAFIDVRNQPKQVQPMSKSTVNTLPKFLLWPEEKTVVENDEVILECLAQNDELFDNSKNLSQTSFAQFFKYKWLKDGKPVDLTNERFKLVQGINLQIQKVQESDIGTYACRICNSNDNLLSQLDKSGLSNLDFKVLVENGIYIQNEFSEQKEECDEKSASLKVLVPPRFTTKPSSANVTLKSDVELECGAHGIPTPTIQWFKNGEPIYSSEYLQYQSNQGNGHLKILGIISQDEGYYQCLASNDLGTVQSIARLIVLSGDDYQIDHDYENSDYTLFNDTKNSKNVVHFSQTKPLSSVQLSAPTNLEVSMTKSRSFTLKWQAPQNVNNAEISPDSLMYTISWKAKNMDRQRELNTSNTSISLDELTPNTVYLIQICAFISSTKGPYSFLEAKTEPEALFPGPPVGFQAEFIDVDVQHTSPTLKFKWKKPQLSTNKLVKYRLYYQHLHYGSMNESLEFKSQEQDYYDAESSFDYINDAKQSNEKYLDIEIPSDSDSGLENGQFYEFLLEDLIKFSTYKFRLVPIEEQFLNLNTSKNFDGYLSSESKITSLDEYVHEYLYSSQNSAELIIETPSDVPDGPPEDLTIETLNTTSILLQWQMPAVEKRNGLIVGYKIAIKENDKQVLTTNVESEPRRKTINNLLPGHKYSVRITARTTNGSGPFTEWQIAETFSHEMDESKVPGQPQDLFVEPTDKSIVIHWIAPENSKKVLVRKYLLKYGIGFPINEIELSGNRNSFIIENLIPSSQYVLSLKAANNAGFGMEILKDVITKRKSAIGENENLFPPLNLQAVAISSQSIELKWTDWHLKPDELIPDDRFYSIRFNVAENSNSKYFYRNSTERNIIISELKPNTLYDFAVKLIIGRRESDWSMTSSQMTMELSPAPNNITIKSDSVSPTDVIITWTAPNYSLNSGRHYFSYLPYLSFNQIYPFIASLNT